MQTFGTAIRKRAQIASANKTMFIFVAGVSALLGFTIVAVIFLSQMLFFNERVLAEKDKTVNNLKSNNKIVTDLEKNIKKLDANTLLIKSKANVDDKTIQVILDALPSEVNSPALASSLEQKLLTNITLESLDVKPVDGVENLNSISGVNTTNEINFTFTVVGNASALKKILLNLESSIRTIDVVSIRIDGQSDPESQRLTVAGKAFYEPAVKVELKEKVVK